ncbi:MAG TPA: hypothetical protein VL403_12580 [Candidatus Kryptonia bacterium]|nr:hypothetical protein [Candidatus Kryptonia bacterium]
MAHERSEEWNRWAQAWRSTWIWLAVTLVAAMVSVPQLLSNDEAVDDYRHDQTEKSGEADW